LGALLHKVFKGCPRNVPAQDLIVAHFHGELGRRQLLLID
jgi:hypothetical protein